MNNSIWSWLFTPFRYIAGGKALLIGIPLMLVSAILCYYSNTYFDGALDLHYGAFNRASPFTTHLWYVFSGWALLTICTYIAGRMVSDSKIRLIDFAGTLSLAKAPMLIALLASFIPATHLPALNDTANVDDAIASLLMHLPVIVFMVIIVVPIMVWTIALMYNAFSISANVKGTKGVLAFIAAILIAEIISKILNYFVAGAIMS